ncbi:FAD-binding protein [Chlorobium sp. N1]|uniref:FAD-binding protein n=1 Tax=Chlorobium sp. N1 TaxID=2491138 RepID=UPI00103CD343|nr:FAD-binding protein [Chlorobium sp. N1]TCD48177.1 FAD-binding protein [Chlorobium sp. N1]
MLAIKEMQQHIRGDLHIGEPLASHTVARRGGPADFLVIPEAREDFCRSLLFFQQRSQPVMVVGSGSRLDDGGAGYRGAVILSHRALQGISFSGGRLVAGAATRLADLHPELGLKEHAPEGHADGSLGGALSMRCCSYCSGLFGQVEWLELFRNGEARRVKPDGMGQGEVILSVAFRLGHKS